MKKLYLLPFFAIFLQINAMNLVQRKNTQKPQVKKTRLFINAMNELNEFEKRKPTQKPIILKFRETRLLTKEEKIDAYNYGYGCGCQDGFCAGLMFCTVALGLGLTAFYSLEQLPIWQSESE